MVRLAILVRVLLGLSLILNGSGYAVAATQMQMTMPAQTAQPARDPETRTEPPCPQHDGNAASASVAPTDAGAVSRTEPVKSTPSPDCCESGVCHCSCVHQAQATIPATAFYAAATGPVGVVSALQPGHAAPALPHLIRPPIG